MQGARQLRGHGRDARRTSRGQTDPVNPPVRALALPIPFSGAYGAALPQRLRDGRGYVPAERTPRVPPATPRGLLAPVSDRCGLALADVQASGHSPAGLLTETTLSDVLVRQLRRLPQLPSAPVTAHSQFARGRSIRRDHPSLVTYADEVSRWTVRRRKSSWLRPQPGKAGRRAYPTLSAGGMSSALSNGRANGVCADEHSAWTRGSSCLGRSDPQLRSHFGTSLEDHGPTSCFTAKVHRLPDAPQAYGAVITRAKAAPPKAVPSAWRFTAQLMASPRFCTYRARQGKGDGIL